MAFWGVGYEGGKEDCDASAGTSGGHGAAQADRAFVFGKYAARYPETQSRSSFALGGKEGLED